MREYTSSDTLLIISCLSWPPSRLNGTSAHNYICQTSASLPDTNKAHNIGVRVITTAGIDTVSLGTAIIIVPDRVSADTCLCSSYVFYVYLITNRILIVCVLIGVCLTCLIDQCRCMFFLKIQYSKYHTKCDKTQHIVSHVLECILNMYMFFFLIGYQMCN